MKLFYSTNGRGILKKRRVNEGPKIQTPYISKKERRYITKINQTK